MLAMIQLSQKTAPQIAAEITEKIKKRRKELHLTQEQLAQKAGVSYASYKRFEQAKEISFVSFIKITIALDLDEELNKLFTRKNYSSIEELIADEKNR